ncbi:ECF transporter S component [Haloimpatiens lingqiaonensis]|uniref:ECF transporter S component n=1 Tax=Haloimpatiens lingqiaonensis TaxID=1380675 RepID=UPI0010FD3D60|nr:ECF transporter S component [Haloimpatiens lingqiaonensis]
MNSKTNNMIKAAIFIAIGLILPYFFHMVGMAGPVFLPMHIPVLLCGMILGWKYGIVVGFITPLLNSFLTGMPPLFPTGISMACELAAYGFLSGYLYKEKRLNIMFALVLSMLGGRFISGIMNYILLIAKGNNFVFKAFLMGTFVKGFIGIIIQLILIPVVVKALEKGEKVTA